MGFCFLSRRDGLETSIGLAGFSCHSHAHEPLSHPVQSSLELQSHTLVRMGARFVKAVLGLFHVLIPVRISLVYRYSTKDIEEAYSSAENSYD